MILMQIESLETQINKLKKANNKTTVIDTLFVIDSTKTFVGMNQRLKNIENGIIDNAEKTLALKNTNQQIELLKQELINQEKLIELRNENLSNRIELLNAIVIGMILSLFAAAIGFVISNYNERKNTNANTV
jgi:predicted RNase H-like nuclease (RuvC/YqgF family)